MTRQNARRPSDLKRLLARFAILLSLPAACLATPLPAPVRQALQSANIPLQNVAVVVQGVDDIRPLVRHNPRQPMNPASVMKLLTTFAALDLLGPAFTWRTETLSDAPPINGRIDGNLYLRGSGDPELVQEQLWLLQRQLRARGVKHIAGDLVLDRSAFELPPHDPAEFDGKPLRPYNAGPDALLTDLDSLSLSLQAEPARNAVSVIVETPDDGLRIANRLQLGNEACGDWRERRGVNASGNTIELTGTFPAACGNNALHLSPWPADVQIARLFRTLWREVGGTLDGGAREGKTPITAVSLASHESPPLAEIVRDINKYSNNVMARQVFLTLDSARPATPEGARRRILAWLPERNLDLPGIVIDNGSGLSRQARIPVDGLARLLLAAWKSPVMPELMASLPVAGVDGTLKKRLGDGAATGHAHLKTGYLENVRSIAGYVLDRHGKRWIVVFLINDANSPRGKPAMDALLEWVAER